MYIIAFSTHLTRENVHWMRAYSFFTWMGENSLETLSCHQGQCSPFSPELVQSPAWTKHYQTPDVIPSLLLGFPGRGRTCLFVPSRSGNGALSLHLFVRLQGQLNVTCPLRLLLGVDLRGRRGWKEGAAHRGQRSAWERGQKVTNNHSDVVAAKKQKNLPRLRPQCRLFKPQTNKGQQCLCCRCCGAQLFCEVMCDIGRSGRAVHPHLLPLSFHINWLPLSLSLPAAPRPKGCEF